MPKTRGLGTFEGVFTPTILTILGVIMYLRLGWLTGNAGLLGAIAIILVATGITICTTLSMASMLSNIRIKSGGAYAIITRSFGLEAGGAIGIPLYLAQAFSAAFYIIGFTELFLALFPGYPLRLVAFLTWAVLTGLSLLSARLSFRLQYLVLLAVVLSIISFLAGPSLNPGGPQWAGSYPEADFWQSFAIFFPAVTGVLAGASMSGELKNPQKSIARGTLAAVLTGLAFYILLAYWFSRQATEEMLLGNTSIILELAYSQPLVIAGMLGAILSSALSTLVGAPRTLAALAENRTVPFSSLLSRKASNFEPRNAVMFSALVSLAVLMVGNLDSIAELLTLFFLAIYGMINLVVFVEQATGIISFRPRFSLSVVVPVAGFAGCAIAMLIINRLFALVTVVVVISFYLLLRRKNLVSPWGDVRGAVFVAMAEWAAQKTMSMPYHPKLWKPSILVPVEKPEDFRQISRFIRYLISPSGRLYYLTIDESSPRCSQEPKAAESGEILEEKEEGHAEQLDPIDEVLLPLKEHDLFAQKIVVNGRGDMEQDLRVVLQSLMSSFLPPNTVFFTLSDDEEKQERFKYVLECVKTLPLGIMCLYFHPKFGFGEEKRINLWLRERSPNLDLAVLSALQLAHNWNASLHLMRAVEDPSRILDIERSLHTFKEAARLPQTTTVEIVEGNFFEVAGNYPADLTVMGMPVDYERMLEVIKCIPGSTVIVSDSGLESALA